MRNRYGNEYHFVPVDDKTYVIEGELEYWRFGAKESNGGNIDINDLGFADPSGGPFLSAGYEIDGKKVERIYLANEKIHLEVEK